MNRIISIILSASLITLSSVAGAQEGKKERGTSLWSLYLKGGSTYASGLETKNVNAAPFMDIFLEFGAGVAFDIKHWARLGLNYEWSGFNRERKYGDLIPLDVSNLYGGKGVVERTEGVAYNKMSTRYHAMDLTAEFNLVRIMSGGKPCRFNLYVGAGTGYMFSHSNAYVISMGQEHIVDGNREESSVWLNARNNRKDWKGAYIPASLSAEYDISPMVTAGLRGDCKFLLKDGDYVPSMITTASAVLMVNLLGKRHGYSSVRSQLKAIRAENESLRKELVRLKNQQ